MLNGDRQTVPIPPREVDVTRTSVTRDVDRDSLCSPARCRNVERAFCWRRGGGVINADDLTCLTKRGRPGSRLSAGAIVEVQQPGFRLLVDVAGLIGSAVPPDGLAYSSLGLHR